MKHLLCIFVFLIASDTAPAQNITVAGPNLGVALPQITASNPGINPPTTGALLGVTLERFFRTGHKRMDLCAGLQVSGYYFNESLVTNGKTAVGPFGFSFGLPLSLRYTFYYGGNFTLFSRIGLIPLMETGGLVRATESDGAIRPNIAPQLALGVNPSGDIMVQFKWFMPVREYGYPSMNSAYRLHTCTFDVIYVLYKKQNPEGKKRE